ncbi:MAG TPA: hypothetical protein VNS34_22075 [Rhizobiaceae bacterium]|nr:hypothetical protein [Rhizobiaceae bacterium]
MLPATINRFKPAVAVMQSITMLQERLTQEDRPSSRLGEAPAQVAAPKDMKSVNELYFGSQLTLTEAMARLMEHVVGYVNDKLALGRDGSQEGKQAGNAWRGEALRDYVEVGSEADFSLPKPGKNGITFQQVARMMLDMFDTESLSRDRALMKDLEQMIGFRLDGMSVTDLLRAFADPASEAADKVRNVLSEGLAGQAGSKVSQRLERAAAGPKSVEETLAGTRKSPIDEVDEETVKEDLEAVKAARTLEKIEKAAELPDKVREALEEMTEAGQSHGRPRIAAAVLQALGTLSVNGADSSAETGASISAAVETVLEASTLPAQDGDNEEPPAPTSVLRAYLEAQDAEDERERRFSLVM